MNYQNMLVSTDNAITTITLNRPEKRNALPKGAGKRGFYSQIDAQQKTAYELAAELMATGALTKDGQEGIKAFLEKRPAVYG